jgi:hypothetical protein
MMLNRFVDARENVVMQSGDVTLTLVGATDFKEVDIL